MSSTFVSNIIAFSLHLDKNIPFLASSTASVFGIVYLSLAGVEQEASE
jgi:hypothetical protein